jgi:hypothetical protein
MSDREQDESARGAGIEELLGESSKEEIDFAKKSFSGPRRNRTKQALFPLKAMWMKKFSISSSSLQ